MKATWHDYCFDTARRSDGWEDGLAGYTKSAISLSLAHEKLVPRPTMIDQRGVHNTKVMSQTLSRREIGSLPIDASKQYRAEHFSREPSSVGDAFPSSNGHITKLYGVHASGIGMISSEISGCPRTPLLPLHFHCCDDITRQWPPTCRPDYRNRTSSRLPLNAPSHPADV